MSIRELSLRHSSAFWDWRENKMNNQYMTKGAHYLTILLMILSFFPKGTTKRKSNKGILVGQREDGGKRAIKTVGSTEPAMYDRVRALIN